MEKNAGQYSVRPMDPNDKIQLVLFLLAMETTCEPRKPYPPWN